MIGLSQPTLYAIDFLTCEHKHDRRWLVETNHGVLLVSLLLHFVVIC